MQINRLFEILYILLDKKTATSKELAERFEVSPRTIYRDVEILSGAGIPVYMRKGKGGGISLLPGFILNKTVLTEREKEDILSSLRALKAVSLTETNTALNKLASLFGESSSDWIEVDFSTWANAREETQIFNTLKSAILARKVVSFTYANTQGQESAREAEPLKLCFKGSAWYLYAYCRTKRDVRFFKLKRIKRLHIEEENFQRHSPARVLGEKNPFPQETVTIKLKLSSQVAYRVYDEFDEFERLPDGSFRAEITCPKNEWLFYYLATFGSHCVVLEPEDIRNQVKAQLAKALDNYR